MAHWQNKEVITTESLFDRLEELNDDLTINSDLYASLCEGINTEDIQKFIEFHNTASGEIWNKISQHFGDNEADAEEFCESLVPEHEEISLICSVLDQIKNYGDIHIKGTRFPSALIKANHFPDYVINFLEQDGMISGLENVVINKAATAERYKPDYSSIEIEGDELFYYRY